MAIIYMCFAVIQLNKIGVEKFKRKKFVYLIYIIYIYNDIVNTIIEL